MLRSPFPRRTLRPLLLSSSVACLALACSYEPTAGAIEYSLSEATLDTLRGADEDGSLLMRASAVESHVEGALEMLFGTPDSPQYLLTEDWIDDEFNPNYGDLELPGDEWDALKQDNRERRFKLQFQQLEQRNYEDVQRPRYADDLWARWQAYLPSLLEDPDGPADDDYFGSRHEEALAMWEGHYPTLAESAEMYRQQCLHCHGNEGGGDGPTSQFLEPRPRDYRKGIFKWVAVGTKQQPRREDLYRILHEGVNGTSMPSFARFSRGELHGLVDYVRLLAIRGQVETLVTMDAVGNGSVTPGSVVENYEFVWEKWLAAEDNYVAFDGEIPEPTAAMVEHGRELFLGPVAACSTCHGEDGRGGGVAIYETDEDGNQVVKPDEWGNPSNPRNFQQAILRGGSRPIDIYRRVKYGISGTIMPAAAAELTDEDLWSIVYYVRSMIEENDHARILERKLAEAAAHAAEHGHGGHGDDHGDDHGHDHGDEEHGRAHDTTEAEEAH